MAPHSSRLIGSNVAFCEVTRVKTVGNSVEGNLGEITGYVFEAVLDGPRVNISLSFRQFSKRIVFVRR